MSLFTVTDGPPAWTTTLYALGQKLVKAAQPGVVAYNLVGTLYLDSASGWLLLSVPTALVRGLFAAMSEPGIELPPGYDGSAQVGSHIPVMSPAEIARAGGSDKINERGKQFSYSVGRLVTVDADGHPEAATIDRAWALTIHSQELQQLRRSYGLSGLPHGGESAFRILCAIRRNKVLGRNDVSKTDAA
jgi:hypothetical protein